MEFCCEELESLATDDPDSKDETFFIEEDGVLHMVVRRIPLKDGTAFDERMVVFCPFCGTRLQEDEFVSAGVRH